MTAICGIVNWDGAPVSPDDLDLMMAALAHHGRDGAQLRTLGAVGLGRQLLHVSGPSIGSSSLPQNRDDLFISATARLDNRLELFQQLRIPRSEQDRYTDSHVILTAYEAWGERCPEFLLGDFALAIWDGRKRRLFCSKDHMGLRPLFYYRDARRFIFASEPKAILAVPGVEKRINRKKLAALASSAANLLLRDQSWFENIYPLPAGMSLTVDEQGTSQRKYWEPTLPSGPPYKGDQEILEAFRSLIFEVVGARLCNSDSVTALLSGGLDSSAIVSVAAGVLERRNQQLHALSAVLPESNDPTLKDERPFIDQFRARPNVTINYVTAAARGPFDDLDEVVWGYDSPLISSRHYLYSAFAGRAQELGASLILDGAGGELGPSSHGDAFYAELLLRFRWLALRREVLAQTEIYGASAWRNFKSCALLPIIRLSREALAAPTLEQHPLQIPFAQNLLSDLLPGARPVRSVRGRLPNQRRLLHQTLLKVQHKGTGVRGFAGYGQVEMSYPFLDKRLLEFCLAVPAQLHVRNGYRRYLIRSGLDGILPPAIQWRTSKEPFSPDYLRRYNSQRQQAQTILEEIRPNDPLRAIVDIERLKQLAGLPVADNERGTPAERAARDIVPAGIYLIHFLRRFAEFRN